MIWQHPEHQHSGSGWQPALPGGMYLVTFWWFELEQPALRSPCALIDAHILIRYITEGEKIRMECEQPREITPTRSRR